MKKKAWFRASLTSFLLSFGLASCVAVGTLVETSGVRDEVKVLKGPDKTSYRVGEALDLQGLEVVAVSSGGSVSLTGYAVQSGGRVWSSGDVLSKEGRMTFRVSHPEHGGEGVFFIDVGDAASADPSAPDQLGKSYELLEEDPEIATVKVENPSSSDPKGFYSPSEVDVAFDISDFAKKAEDRKSYTPSKGKTPLLVIPVVLPGDEARATEENLALIEKVFFGASDDLHFESLHSYYYKSSYGHLDFTGKVTDYYETTKDPKSYFQRDGSLVLQQQTETLAQQAADWAERTYGLNLDSFDSDDDGVIDGVWMIFLHPSDSNSQSPFWAYSDSSSRKGSKEKPVAGIYAWAGIEFIDGTLGSAWNTSEENPDAGGDAHVVIHETGHMLGLSDYYSHSHTNVYSPLGKIDPMDSDVGDHNSYSKILLGWVTPTVVTGSASVQLRSTDSKDSAIVIPYDGRRYRTGQDGRILFNPFDEYLVIDLFSPTDLNQKGYHAYSVAPPTAVGARIYHVDARLAKGFGIFSLGFLESPDDVFSPSVDSLSRIVSNTDESVLPNIVHGPYYRDEWDEIRWISADKRKIDGLSGQGEEANARLFLDGSSFSSAEYASSFVGGALDNGKAFSSSISFALK